MIESAPVAASARYHLTVVPVAAAAAAIGAAKKGGKDELVFYQKVSLGTGSRPVIHGCRNCLTLFQKQPGIIMH